MASAANKLIVPAHLASSALQALKAPFTHAGVDALVVGRGSRIEVYALEPTGLALSLTIELHASVVSIASFVPSGATTASLVVLTAAPTWKLLVLRHDPSSASGVRTEASESLFERAARPAEGVQTVAVDPYGRCIVVLAYDGLLRVFPLVSAPTHRRRSSSARGAAKPTPLDLSRSYNVRLSMLNVHQLAFLSLGESVPPTLGILHTDHQGQKVFRVRAIDMAEKELVAGSAPSNDFVMADPGSELFVPVPEPGPGVIVVGEEEATFIALSDPAPGPLESPKGKGRAGKATRPSCRLPIGVYSACVRPALDQADMAASARSTMIHHASSWPTSTARCTCSRSSARASGSAASRSTTWARRRQPWRSSTSPIRSSSSPRTTATRSSVDYRQSSVDRGRSARDRWTSTAMTRSDCRSSR